MGCQSAECYGNISSKFPGGCRHSSQGSAATVTKALHGLFYKTPVIDRAITSRVLQEYPKTGDKSGSEDSALIIVLIKPKGLMITHNHINSQRSSNGFATLQSSGMQAH